MKKNVDIQHSQKTFKIPQSYFEEFEVSLFQKIKTFPSTKPSSISTHSWFTLISVAASIALFIGFLLHYKSDAYSKLNSESIENYLQSETLSVSNEIENYLDEQDLIEIEKTIPINQNEMDDYLLTNVDVEFYLSE